MCVCEVSGFWVYSHKLTALRVPESVVQLWSYGEASCWRHLSWYSDLVERWVKWQRFGAKSAQQPNALFVIPQLGITSHFKVSSRLAVGRGRGSPATIHAMDGGREEGWERLTLQMERSILIRKGGKQNGERERESGGTEREMGKWRRRPRCFA